MTSDLPPPVETPDFYLRAINDRLGELLDRLPVRPEREQADGAVELREPAASAPMGGGEGQSSTSKGDAGRGPGAKARRPAHGPSAPSKSSARKRTPKKET